MAFFTIKNFADGLSKKIASWLINTDENVALHGTVDSAGAEILGVLTASPNAQSLAGRLLALATILGEVQTSPTANTVGDRLKALAVLMGEVQTTPTANTLLARLKAIQDNTDGIEGFTDGIEGLIGTTNSTLTTLAGYVDTLETLIGSTNTAIGTTNSTLSTIGGYVDGLEALFTTLNSLITTQNGYLDGLEGFVDGLETNTAAIASTNTKLDSIISATQAPGQQLTNASTSIVPASDSPPFPITTYLADASTDITRPADTTAYAPNDVWAHSTSAPTAGGYTLANMARISGGGGILTDIMITSSAVPGTLLQAELHLFDQAATAVNDNAAWGLSDGDAKNRIAIIPFTLLADANNSYVHLQNLNIGYRCVSTRDLRYLVKVKNAYTPASGEVLTVRAKGVGVN